MIQLAALLLGAGLICFGLSTSLWLSLLLMIFVGFGMMQSLSASNTIIQTLVPEEMRARVMSYYTMAFVGMAPFGNLLAGTLANRFGAPLTVIFSGGVCLLGWLWFSFELPRVRAVMRPIYQEMGLLPTPESVLATEPEPPVAERVARQQ
jgi:MFS family permease